MMFIVWGRAMKDYVSHVLPSLGVSGVTVDTWTSWSKKMMQSHFGKLPRKRNEMTPPIVQRWKLSSVLRKKLETDLLALAYVDKTQVLQTWMECITDLTLLESSFPNLSTQELQEAKKHLTKQNQEFSLWADEHEDQDLVLDYEDDALILRAYQIAIGPLRKKGRQINFLIWHLMKYRIFLPLKSRFYSTVVTNISV